MLQKLKKFRGPFVNPRHLPEINISKEVSDVLVRNNININREFDILQHVPILKGIELRKIRDVQLDLIDFNDINDTLVGEITSVCNFSNIYNYYQRQQRQYLNLNTLTGGGKIDISNIIGRNNQFTITINKDIPKNTLLHVFKRHLLKCSDHTFLQYSPEIYYKVIHQILGYVPDNLLNLKYNPLEKNRLLFDYYDHIAYLSNRAFYQNPNINMDDKLKYIKNNTCSCCNKNLLLPSYISKHGSSIKKIFGELHFKPDVFEK